MENEKKKKMQTCIFQNFSSSWKEGRKNSEEKKNGVQNRLGYCLIVLQRGRILCCNTFIVLQRFRLGGLNSVLQY